MPLFISGTAEGGFLRMFPSDNRAWATPYYINLNMTQNAVKEN